MCIQLTDMIPQISMTVRIRKEHYYVFIYLSASTEGIEMYHCLYLVPLVNYKSSSRGSVRLKLGRSDNTNTLQ